MNEWFRDFSLPWLWACGLAVGISFAPQPANADGPWDTFQNGGKLVFPEAKLPVQWSPSEAIAWQTTLAGYGQSSPVVCNDQIYVTSTSGKNKEQIHVEAIDRDSGQRRWLATAKNSTPEESTNYVSRAAPTPVCDDHGVIALFEGGNVIALDKDGKERWQRDLVADYGPITARHGLGASLEQNATCVFAWIEREQEPYLVALSKATGETVWKSAGLGATTWSSPRLVPTADGHHLVCSASGKIAGYDPATGKKLWEFSDISNNTVCTPIPLGDGKFLIGASDGRGEQAESGAPSNGVIQIAKSDDGTYSAGFLWRAKRATSSFGSPLAAGKHAYFVNRVGVLFKLDLESGEQLTTSRIEGGSIWATPVIADGRLYCFGYKGTTSVVSLDSGEETATNRLWEAPAESPAPGGRPSFGGHVLYAAVAAPPYWILRRGDTIFAVKASAETR